VQQAPGATTIEGVNCPLPILRAKKALAALSAGQVLHIIATESREEGGKFHFLMKKS